MAWKDLAHYPIGVGSGESSGFEGRRWGQRQQEDEPRIRPFGSSNVGRLSALSSAVRQWLGPYQDNRIRSVYWPSLR